MWENHCKSLPHRFKPKKKSEKRINKFRKKSSRFQTVWKRQKSLLSLHIKHLIASPRTFDRFLTPKKSHYSTQHQSRSICVMTITPNYKSMQLWDSSQIVCVGGICVYAIAHHIVVVRESAFYVRMMCRFRYGHVWITIMYNGLMTTKCANNERWWWYEVRADWAGHKRFLSSYAECVNIDIAYRWAVLLILPLIRTTNG